MLCPPPPDKHGGLLDETLTGSSNISRAAYGGVSVGKYPAARAAVVCDVVSGASRGSTVSGWGSMWWQPTTATIPTSIAARRCRPRRSRGELSHLRETPF